MENMKSIHTRNMAEEHQQCEFIEMLLVTTNEDREKLGKLRDELQITSEEL